MTSLFFKEAIEPLGCTAETTRLIFEYEVDYVSQVRSEGNNTFVITF